MPVHIRAHVQWQVGSMLARDIFQITPCFRHQSLDPVGGTGWQTLADDLAAAVNTWSVSATRQLAVRLYEIKPPVAGSPNRPKAIKVLSPAAAADYTIPRELSLCLSFSGGEAGPRQRGRLYVPGGAIPVTSPGARPTNANMTKVGDLANVFASLGGIDVDWIVWSPTRDAATKVERWFVDDEWDTQRRRGHRPLTRVEGTTGG